MWYEKKKKSEKFVCCVDREGWKRAWTREAAARHSILLFLCCMSCFLFCLFAFYSHFLLFLLAMQTRRTSAWMKQQSLLAGDIDSYAESHALKIGHILSAKKTRERGKQAKEMGMEHLVFTQCICTRWLNTF